MPLNQNPGFHPGDWNALCDICGGQYLASELKKQWDGFYACPKDFTTRNPQDFIRPILETSIPTFIRPDDTSGDIITATMIAGVPSVITASLTDLKPSFQTATVGLFALTFPSANDATYNGFSVVLAIELVLPSINSTNQDITIIAPATGSLVGSQTIKGGTIATFRSNPTTNTWTREH